MENFVNACDGAKAPGERLVDTDRIFLETYKGSTPFERFLDQFESPIVLVLLAAAITSAFVRD
jgi:magnesium-transporting ATPase (P-type)